MALDEVRGLVVALNKATDAPRIVDVLGALGKASVTVPILHELKCGAVAHPRGGPRGAEPVGTATAAVWGDEGAAAAARGG